MPYKWYFKLWLLRFIFPSNYTINIRGGLYLSLLSCTNGTRKFDCSILHFHHITQLTPEVGSTAFSNSKIWILCLSELLYYQSYSQKFLHLFNSEYLIYYGLVVSNCIHTPNSFFVSQKDLFIICRLKKMDWWPKSGSVTKIQRGETLEDHIQFFEGL